ncbi:hypothetical protein F443_21619 [Phytophthora nicotianae P1569]|uniref:Uncharacterized protein n=1 Tax=Phytophthora nicotianae P1569 TaxID=1317065 RepID=V9DX11_PHYNI|nr:hypothetical protein F443_21619 [Phytophthora nicotianae P1569]
MTAKRAMQCTNSSSKATLSELKTLSSGYNSSNIAAYILLFWKTSSFLNPSIMTQARKASFTELALLPLISTPPRWSSLQRDHVSTQLLQEFEKNAYVMACNIPGPVHMRYLYLMRRLPCTVSNGKRRVSFVQVIATTKANERSRSAEALYKEVEWVQEGGTFTTLMEVDERTVDVSYDQWASCHDDHHAQRLFIQWAQFVSRLSQTIEASRLLVPGE